MERRWISDVAIADYGQPYSDGGDNGAVLVFENDNPAICR